MKKLFKLLIIGVVIFAVAFGVYKFLNNGTDNNQIYAKVYALNNEIVVNEENIYTKLNGTIVQMVELIDSRGYEIPEVKRDFEVYLSILSNYSIIKTEILNKGLFVNKNNTNPNFKDMNSAYNKLEKLYKEGYEYLSGTHYLITNEENYNKDYIVNFHNIFKGALSELNKFYVNAGISYAYGTENMFENNNLYKLEVEYYCLLSNTLFNDYLLSQTINEESVTVISEQALVLTSDFTQKYFENKNMIDEIVENKKINKSEVVNHHLAGTVSDYLNTKDEEQKSIINNYLTLIIEEK